MNWLKSLAEDIKQSKDGDVILVLNETRVELAERAAERLGKKVSFKVAHDTSRLSERERWLEAQTAAAVRRNLERP